MKLPTQAIILYPLALASANPNPDQAQAPVPSQQNSQPNIDFASLNKPMHTTALMAGEALRLSKEVEAARTRSATSVPTGRSKEEEQMDL